MRKTFDINNVKPDGYLFCWYNEAYEPSFCLECGGTGVNIDTSTNLIWANCSKCGEIFPGIKGRTDGAFGLFLKRSKRRLEYEFKM